MTFLVRQPAERLVLAGIAAILLILGLPQATESALRLAGGLDEDPPASLTDRVRPALARQTAQLERLDEEFGDPQARIRAGILRLRLAVQPDGTLDADSVGPAAGDLRQGLARAPANALAWMVLAYAELALGDAGLARKALSLSLSAAPHDPAVTLSRCQVGLVLWPSLAEEERKRVASQISQAWILQPDAVLELARGGYRALISDALTTDPERQAAYEKALTSASPAK